MIPKGRMKICTNIPKLAEMRPPTGIWMIDKQEMEPFKLRSKRMDEVARLYSHVRDFKNGLPLGIWKRRILT